MFITFPDYELFEEILLKFDSIPNFWEYYTPSKFIQNIKIDNIYIKDIASTYYIIFEGNEKMDNTMTIMAIIKSNISLSIKHQSKKIKPLSSVLFIKYRQTINKIQEITHSRSVESSIVIIKNFAKKKIKIHDLPDSVQEYTQGFAKLESLFNKDEINDIKFLLDTNKRVYIHILLNYIFHSTRISPEIDINLYNKGWFYIFMSYSP